MTDSRAVLDADRLPWLPNDPLRARDEGWQSVFAWALGAALLVAGVSFWMGLRSQFESPPAVIQRPGPAATVTLPEALPAPPPRSVEIAPMPVVEPIAEPRPVEPARTRDIEPTAKLKPAAVAKAQTRPVKPAKRATAPAKAKRAPKLALWPAYRSNGANGRVVRLGTFASRRQAKLGWRKVTGVYPGMRRLPAVVVPVQSKRDGKIYYRLQMGTTSQAHSTVVCQWMRQIGQACVVVGLPGAAARRAP